MSAVPLAVLGTGLVSSVGLSSPAACAAIRAKLTNPTESRFIASGEWIMTHTVPLETRLPGREKLIHMAALAASEAMNAIPREDWPRIPLILCVAEPERPGREPHIDQQLLEDIFNALGTRFSNDSAVISRGRVGAAVALLQARNKFAAQHSQPVLIVATDSLLSANTLQELAQRQRLLTPENSNGFMPGEGAAAVLVAPGSMAASSPRLVIEGIGFGVEAATIDSEEPLRGDGLSRAVRECLLDAGCEMHDVDFRICDISGEQYYFKEASLVVSRLLRKRKEQLDIWHPAECIGEMGSAIGPALIAVAAMAGRKGYAPGPSMLLHFSNDAGQRAALFARYVVN